MKRIQLMLLKPKRMIIKNLRQAKIWLKRSSRRKSIREKLGVTIVISVEGFSPLPGHLESTLSCTLKPIVLFARIAAKNLAQKLASRSTIAKESADDQRKSTELLMSATVNIATWVFLLSRTNLCTHANINLYTNKKCSNAAFVWWNYPRIRSTNTWKNIWIPTSTSVKYAIRNWPTKMLLKFI